MFGRCFDSLDAMASGAVYGQHSVSDQSDEGTQYGCRKLLLRGVLAFIRVGIATKIGAAMLRVAFVGFAFSRGVILVYVNSLTAMLLIILLPVLEASSCANGVPVIGDKR